MRKGCKRIKSIGYCVVFQTNILTRMASDWRLPLWDSSFYLSPEGEKNTASRANAECWVFPFRENADRQKGVFTNDEWI